MGILCPPSVTLFPSVGLPRSSDKMSEIVSVFHLLSIQTTARFFTVKARPTGTILQKAGPQKIGACVFQVVLTRHPLVSHNFGADDPSHADATTAVSGVPERSLRAHRMDADGSTDHESVLLREL